MRKTKIICTIGPSCSTEETLRQMCLEGMNVARLNFSHGTHEEHLDKIRMLKKIRQELGEDAYEVATGGMALMIAEESKVIDKLDGLLTLKGLRLIYERNRTDN